MITKETTYIKNILNRLGRNNKILLLTRSNLNDRELDLLTKRFINGLSIKECSVELGLEENTISKNQEKAVKKLYAYLTNDIHV